MGGKTETVQQQGLSNPAMNQAATTIGNQLNTQLGAGVKGFTGSLVPDMSSQTQAGLNALSNNPNDAAYGAGITNAINRNAQIASGNIENDAVRQRVLDDAITGTNAVFASNGRFGGGTHEKGLAENAVNALAQHDYGREQAAMAALPSLYQASSLPASAQMQAGQLWDAFNTSKAQDAERIFDVTNNDGWNTLQRGSAIFSGTAPVSGTTSTQSVSQPWWVAPTAIAGTLGSAFF